MLITFCRQAKKSVLNFYNQRAALFHWIWKSDVQTYNKVNKQIVPSERQTANFRTIINPMLVTFKTTELG